VYIIYKRIEDEKQVIKNMFTFKLVMVRIKKMKKSQNFMWSFIKKKISYLIDN